MSRRPEGGLLALAALVALGGLGCGEAASPPSIVLVTLDTLRSDHVGAYGSYLGYTPNLDALAARGMVFESAFTTMPTTAPAHASLFTGLRPHEHGVGRNGVALPEAHRERALPARLRVRGFATGAFVSVSLLSQESSGLPGFGVHDGPEKQHRAGTDTVEAALEWLAGEPRRPVFLWVHLYDPHAPYGDVAARRAHPRVDPGRHGFVDPSRFETREQRSRVTRLYAQGVRDADAALGKLVAGVEGKLSEDVLWLLVADHGEALAEYIDTRSYAFDHGEFLDDEQIRIPLVVAGAGVEAGRREEAVSIRDLYGTILAAAGLDAEGGRDLRGAGDQGRLVAASARRLHPRETEHQSESRVRTLDGHAVAVTDGVHTVVIGEDGSPTVVPEELAEGGASVLLDEARRLLALRVRDPAAAPPLDPDRRRALEALGYLEQGVDSGIEEGLEVLDGEMRDALEEVRADAAR